MINIESVQCYHGSSLRSDEGAVFLSPHPLLSAYIANYTVTCPSKGAMSQNYTILPTASATLVYSIANGAVVDGLRGVNTKAAVVGAQANQYEILLLIEFHPAGLYPLIKIPQSEILDISFRFSELSLPLHREILALVSDADDLEWLKDGLDRIFLSRLQSTDLHPMLSCAVGRIYDTRGAMNVRELSKEMFQSERQLERIFKRHIGTGVKTFSRIVRMNHALHLLQTTNEQAASVAAAIGYFDQAHFIHDFHALCETTPQAYLESMSDFYNDAFKM